ncbi:hypothetical protein Vretimale_17527 [Volvox reticuliferus]|uniref:Uncharacterized protein n=1 Tax=Volvox reticuliferus TaxID=1737510 RepID=A0A8J4D2J8_9CHLO|nr:hypothetical protein Vretifemale_18177 [Volvox reticuliferus]GIM14603.1 hypothetical protein Vretimale_17527 [Volvox reticuliferus]
MVPPPKRVDAVEVHNSTAHPLNFKVTYDDHKDKKEITESFVVQPGEKHLFPEKELDMGTWQAVAPVVRVEVEGPEGSHHLTPAVSGVVKVLQVAAATGSGGAGGLRLTQSN